MNKYYVSLGVQAGATYEEICRELELLRLALDFISKDKAYSVEVGLEYSGDIPVLIDLTICDIDLTPFLRYKKRIFFKDDKPELRLWSFGRSLVVFSSESKWTKNEFISKYCGDKVFNWKGRNYGKTDKEAE